MPGSAALVLVEGVRHLDEAAAVFDAMVEGWSCQQLSRRLGETTVRRRAKLLRRFVEFCGEYPWGWTPGDMEDFTAALMSGPDRRAASTIRGYQVDLRVFCDYLTDARYEWPGE